MRYGAGLDIPVTMCVTALRCSSFACSLRSNHLREQRLSVPGPRPLPSRGHGDSPGLEGACEEGLVAGGRGEEEAGQAALHGQLCSPVLDLQWQPVEGEGHVEPQIVHKLLLQPGKEQCEQGTGMLPHTLPAHARPSACLRGAAGSPPARPGPDTTHLEEKPSLTFSSSTPCT